jgi:hypothetical protein
MQMMRAATSALIALLLSATASFAQNRAPVDWLFVAIDKPGTAEARRAATGPHVPYIDGVLAQLLVGGPIVDADRKIIGSMLLYRAETEAQARALFENDPLTKAGIFETVTVQRFVGAAGTFLGGTSWGTEIAQAPTLKAQGIGPAQRSR